MKRTFSIVALSGVLVVGLATTAFAGGPGTFNGASMTRPTTATPKYGSITGSGCGATTAAKSDRSQTIFSDLTADANLYCNYVRTRVYVYSGSSGYYTAWDKDVDSAVVLNSVYTTAYFQMTVSSID